MKKQGETEVKRVTIKKEGKLIEINTYIMTFDQPKIPENIKVGYTIERLSNSYLIHCVATIVKNTAITRIIVEVDNNVANVLDNCNNPCRCANCGGDHPVYARSCES